MTGHRTITLGGVTLEVAPLPLGTLKRLLPVFAAVGQACARGDLGESTLGQLTSIIALATGRSEAELDAMPCTYTDLLAALDTVSDVCGIKPREESPPGESRPGSAT